MNTFFIIPNSQKDGCVEKAMQIRDWLEAHGRSCAVRTNHESAPAGTDCVLVLGGDGTLLQAAREMVGRDIPLLGINLGTLGYLAEIEAANVYEALEGLLAERYTLEKRMLLDGEIIRDGEVIRRDMALNDIVITRRGHLRVVDFNIEVNGAFLCSYRADGIILATPTGSTGYSLSAGGPIVSPDAFLILLTAIAPHTLNARPVVLPEQVEVMVEAAGGRFTEEDGADVTFDGSGTLSLQSGDRIRVRRHEKETRLVRVRRTSFVEILRSKLQE